MVISTVLMHDWKTCCVYTEALYVALVFVIFLITASLSSNARSHSHDFSLSEKSLDIMVVQKIAIWETWMNSEVRIFVAVKAFSMPLFFQTFAITALRPNQGKGKAHSECLDSWTIWQLMVVDRGYSFIVTDV